jgi:uncharacterized sulfatase
MYKRFTLFFLLVLITACGSSSDNDEGIVSPTNQIDNAPEQQPNILLILADDLSHDHYGFTGHPVVQTPSLDVLASESVRYPNAYVSSTCRATLASLLTGLPEHAHGVTYVEGPPLADMSTITDRMMNAGYTTLQAGKFWEGPATDWGFSGFVPFDSFLGNLSIGRTSIQPLLDRIDQASSPWFMWFSPYMPHLPAEAPQEYIDLYEGSGLHPAIVGYYAMISWFDDVVGEVLQALPEDTVVVYLADNGYIQAPSTELIILPRTKGTSYEYGVRTQLLIRHPGYSPIVRNELASAVDVSATILALADVYHEDLPGRDVLAPAPPEPRVFGSRSVQLGADAGRLLERWMRRGDWKLVDVEEDEDRLFNLESDPGEDNNLVDAPEWSVLRDELQAELEAWWVQ